jgi:predicted dehydrogenase
MSTITRRRFLGGTAGVTGLLVLPSWRGESAPSERIAMACTGVGGRGRANMSAFLNDGRVQMVAVCDVDDKRADSARQAVDAFYAKQGKTSACKAYRDYREVLARPDLDAVMVGTPDHTHALLAVAAMRSGKDVYCEKPLAYSVAEGRSIVAAATRYGRILQTGTQRRSNARIRHACELVRNGVLGPLQVVEVGLPRGFQIRNGAAAANQKAVPVPAWFDYDKWLGPAPYAPYTPARCHFNFRWILAYGEGYISDWGAHYLDVAHWGIGADRTGPQTVAATATFPTDGLYDAPTDFHIEYGYANGARVACGTDVTLGMKFVGRNGWLHVEKPGSPAVVASDPVLLKAELPGDGVRLYRSTNHHTNFIDCVLSRQETAAPPEVGHRSASVCHVGMIAARLGRDLHWDPAREVFPKDREANRLLSRPFRAPYAL